MGGDVPGLVGALPVTPLRLRISRFVAVLAIGAIAAAFLLLSPIAGRTHPGAIPWSEWSLLRPIVGVLSLGGVFQTERGAEIKDVAFHLAAAIGMAVLALRLVRVPVRRLSLPDETWFHALLLLGAWVGLSAVSSLWSGDAALSLKQAALYAFAVGWVAALAGTLELPHLGRLMTGIGAASAVMATLTIWYYCERNPHHRPGFPIGNPSVLAANLLPAMLLSLAWLAGGMHAWRRRRVRPPWHLIVGAFAILGICGGGFVLAGSRGGMLGLICGLVTLAYLALGRRGRLAASVGGMLVIGGAGILFYLGRLSTDGMARAATIRLRLYAWQYASEIWNTRPMFGAGAASFTRYGTQYSSRDRFLDPVAFMGEWLEHAHNEFFEVFAEIGLFGGVTFVAAWVALLAAAGRMLRSGVSAERRWLIIGITAAIVAVLADAQFGVALRLPGGGVLFWTLVGALLAACRCASRPASPPGGEPALEPPHERARQLIAATISPVRIATVGSAILASLLLAALGTRNAIGLLFERVAYAQFAARNYADAMEAADFAGPRLLTPVRALLVEERGMQARSALWQERVRELLRALRSQPESAPASTSSGDLERLISEAIDAARAAYSDALQLERRAPMMPRAAAIRARAAEMIAMMLSERDPRAAREWQATAEATWRQHREQRPDDVETLLALTRYALARFALTRDTLFLDECVSHLRDALRAGFAPPEWHAALAQALSADEFDGSIARMIAAAGPFDPRTDLDTLVRSRAPEAYRLRAAVHAGRGEFDAAARDAAHAAGLYEPMRPRFVTILSVAMYEQAENVLRESPSRASDAATIVQRAIDALPHIQEQQLADLAAPYRRLLAICLLAGGDEPGGLAALTAASGDAPTAASSAGLLADAYVSLAEAYIRVKTEHRPDVRPWLDAALRHVASHGQAWGLKAWLAAESGDIGVVRGVLNEAAAAGVDAASLRGMISELERAFPDLGRIVPAGS